MGNCTRGHDCDKVVVIMDKRWKHAFAALLCVASVSFLSSAAALFLYAWHFIGRQFSSNGSDWAAYGEFFGGVLNPALAAVNMLVVVFIAYELQRIDSQREQETARAEQTAREALEERARHDRAIALHEYFLSPDFYSKVRAPVFQVGLTWMHLKEDLRGPYRDAVVQGWTTDVGENKLNIYVPLPPNSQEECMLYHFQTPKGLPSLTEHQALTAMLRFWTRTRILIDLKMLDRSLVRSLFQDEFGHLRVFLRSLSEAVSGTGNTPRWIDDLDQLDKIFASTDSNKR